MKKLTQSEKIRRALKADPTAKFADIAKKLGVRYQAVWTVAKAAKPKAVKDMKKDGLRRNPQGKILMQASAPVVGEGNAYEQKDGKWQAVATVTSDTSISDNVNHPAHYKTGGIETIDFIEAKGLTYHLGNAVKYITRADHKGNRLEDLQKARWYLDREISRIS